MWLDHAHYVVEAKLGVRVGRAGDVVAPDQVRSVPLRIRPESQAALRRGTLAARVAATPTGSGPDVLDRVTLRR